MLSEINLTSRKQNYVGKLWEIERRNLKEFFIPTIKIFHSQQDSQDVFDFSSHEKL